MVVPTRLAQAIDSGIERGFGLWLVQGMLRPPDEQMGKADIVKAQSLAERPLYAQSS